jgi:ParB family chromosome partitioning protein
VANLIEPLKKRLDDGKFSLRAAIELSYLSEDTQKMTNEILEDSDCHIEAKTAKELRSAEVDGVIELDIVRGIIEGAKQPAQIFMKSVKLDSDVLTRYFTNEQSADDVSDTIAKALDAWFAKLD